MKKTTDRGLQAPQFYNAIFATANNHIIPKSHACCSLSMTVDYSMLERCSVINLEWNRCAQFMNASVDNKQMALIFTLICLVLAVQAILLESNCRLVIGPSYAYISKMDPVRKSQI
jgi:hypothetical protein